MLANVIKNMLEEKFENVVLEAQTGKLKNVLNWN